MGMGDWVPAYAGMTGFAGMAAYATNVVRV
jgi:hypothetical protein